MTYVWRVPADDGSGDVEITPAVVVSGGVPAIVAALKAHTWYLSGNLGVPGMADATTYKCYCGWSGDDPHVHVAEAVAGVSVLKQGEQR